METWKSDLVQELDNRGIIRTVNHRATTLTTIAKFPPATYAKNTNSIILLSPIPFMGALISVTCRSSDGEFGFADMGIYGIRSNGSVDQNTVINRKALRPGKIVLEDNVVDILHPGDWGITLHELCCDDNGIPIETYEPYVGQRFGMLALTGINDNTVTVNTSLQFRIQYVEGNASEMIQIGKSNNRRS